MCRTHDRIDACVQQETTRVLVKAEIVAIKSQYSLLLLYTYSTVACNVCIIRTAMTEGSKVSKCVYTLSLFVCVLALLLVAPSAGVSLIAHQPYYCSLQSSVSC
jgi:hypothetical protein